MMKRLGWMLLILGVGGTSALGNDWPAWRGPEQTGMSREDAVITSWSEDGENLLWRVPVGGRSTPIVMNGRMYSIGPVGTGGCLQERIFCLDANTGLLIWEHRFNVFHTDIVENRVGWTSLVGDPETGNIYGHGTGGQLFAYDKDGKRLWTWSLTEELGRSSGYGGRLHTPIIDEDRVIISFTYILTQWGTGKKKAGHRYYAFDKHTGEVVWIGQPGGKPKNTTYSTPVVTVADGRRILVAPNADGNIYGMEARTGRKIWTFKYSLAGLNSTGVARGRHFYLSHSEENVKGTEMGALVCIDVTGKGDITDTGEVWRVDGIKGGYSSLALGTDHVYVAENNAVLHAFDAMTGKKAWEYDVGRAMKGSPVVTADGVIYVGEVNGMFHILKDKGDKCVKLDYKEFTRSDGLVVEIQGSPAISNGRVYFMTRYDTYCLGKTTAKTIMVSVPPMEAEDKPAPGGTPFAILHPAVMSVAPGDEIQLRISMFDGKGTMFGAAPLPAAAPTGAWTVKGVAGTVSEDGMFHASAENKFSAGTVTLKMGELTATARIRISPKLPISESFDKMAIGKQAPGWIGIDAKTAIVQKDGEIVFQKRAKSPSAKYARMRSYSNPPIEAGYTVQADLFGEPKKGRKTLSDMGLINDRYLMILLAKEKAIRLVSWGPIPRVQKDVPFDWQPNTWYTAKFSVDVTEGTGVIRAKVWKRGEDEPKAWMAEVRDACPNLEGSPGLYAYTKGTSAKRLGAMTFFDNYKVTRN
jgi:outer membrane protein assembly factor BamB